MISEARGIDSESFFFSQQQEYKGYAELILQIHPLTS
jgi:hypothetical protein